MVMQCEPHSVWTNAAKYVGQRPNAFVRSTSDPRYLLMYCSIEDYSFVQRMDRGGAPLRKRLT
jgi:hypothetical protein